jgi:hypothetical protein
MVFSTNSAMSVSWEYPALAGEVEKPGDNAFAAVGLIDDGLEILLGL